MNITKGQKKKKSIELLRKLHIYEAYIDGFRKNDYVCYFEGYGGYWVYQDPELEKKMKALEKEYACTVYAITHEFTEFGECYSFLLVTDYKEEWDNLIYPEGNKYYAFAYGRSLTKGLEYKKVYGSNLTHTLYRYLLSLCLNTDAISTL